MATPSSYLAGTSVDRAFDDLPASELEAVAAKLTRVDVEAGGEIVKLDDRGNAIYFVEEGRAAGVGGAPRGEKTLGPGDVIGEISLLLTGQRTSTVVARTRMQLLSLSGQDFELIRARVPTLE